jgi:hypothetical protein
MSREIFGKPKPDAIATIYGWADSKTGELLVSKRGLPNPVQGYKRNCPFIPQVTVAKSSKIEIQEVVVQPKQPVVKKPKAPRRKVNDSQE